MRRLTTLLIALLGLGPALQPVDMAAAQAPVSDPDLMQRRMVRMERQLALGRAHAAAGHGALAQRHFEDALRENPSAPEPYLELGRAFLSLGRPTDAVAILESGRHRAPDDSALLSTLADALVANARAPDALRLLREAARRRRADVQLHLQRGDLARQLGAWSEAADAYAALLDLARRGEPVPDDVVRRARDTLRALGIVLGDAHPRARRCDSAEGAEADRWQRALAACEAR